MRKLCLKSARPTVAPSLWRLVNLGASLVCFGLMLLASGCATVPSAAAGPAQTAHFVIVNLSDCAWQITLSPAGGGPARVLHPAARESEELDLAGGSYGIEHKGVDWKHGRRFDATFHNPPRVRADLPLASRNAAVRPAGWDASRPTNDEHERER